MSETKKVVMFAPGLLEQMELDHTTEELQDILDEIALLAQDPSQGILVDMVDLMQQDPLLYAELIANLEACDDVVVPTLQ